MLRERETGVPDVSEVRFGAQEWLGAVLSMAAVLGGAGLALAAAYWFLVR